MWTCFIFRSRLGGLSHLPGVPRLHVNRLLRASSRAESKLITSQSEFAIFLFLPQERNVRMTLKWHIWLVIDSWNLTASIRNSVRGRTEFCKMIMNSSRRNLYSPTFTFLLIFDRRPPPWKKFLSLSSLPLPLKSRMVAIIFVKKILSTRSPKLRLLCRLECF